MPPRASDPLPGSAVPRPGPARTFWQSLKFAFAGLRHTFHSQRNARIHVAVALIAIGFGFFLGISRAEWAVIATLIALVFALETLNTGIEALVDLVSPGYHPLAKVAKDASAAAVLLVALGSVAAGVIIFLPRLWALFF